LRGYLRTFAKANSAQQLAAVAWEFVKFLTSTQGTVLWAEHSHGYLPVGKSAKNLMTTYLSDDPTQATAFANLSNANAEDNLAWYRRRIQQVSPVGSDGGRGINRQSPLVMPKVIAVV
jgi:ABC-type glycerol-3-phosphate transport system substrate-binding protein